MDVVSANGKGFVSHSHKTCELTSAAKVLERAGFGNCGQLRWRVAWSENKLIQTKDWLPRSARLDGVLRCLAHS